MLALGIFDEYVAWLQVNVPLAYESLAPPATPFELAALEAAIGDDRCTPLPAGSPVVGSVREDYIEVNLDPDSSGKARQTINFGRNEQQHSLCAPEFTGLLQILPEEVRPDAWQASQPYEICHHSAKRVPTVPSYR